MVDWDRHNQTRRLAKRDVQVRFGICLDVSKIRNLVELKRANRMSDGFIALRWLGISFGRIPVLVTLAKKLGTNNTAGTLART